MESGCWTSFDRISSTADGLREQLKLASYPTRALVCALLANWKLWSTHKQANNNNNNSAVPSSSFLAGANYISAAQLVKC
jgi:hypothetical protein